MPMRRTPRRSRESDRAASLAAWEPKTRLGKLVRDGHITSIDEIFQVSTPIREVQILDILLPNLEEEFIGVNLVQRQTDAGEVNRFKATIVVGNRQGFVGVGSAKMKEIGPAINAAIVRAKLNIIPVKLGCGSWECEGGADHSHSIPYRLEGHAGSVKITLFPAPKGVGLAAADTAKAVLRLAGVRDVWSKTRGATKTSANLAWATYYALKSSYKVMTPNDWVK
ncbi:MAG: 30S ribosomal protein S5 [Candidatus Ranarchaeia archaeon]